MLKDRLKYLFWEDHWNIRLLFHPKTDFQGGDFAKAKQIVISNERGAFYADPFVLSESPLTILCEEFIFSSQHGRIVSLTLDGNYQVIRKKILLENKQAHYSYPFVFEEAGAIYVIPESSSEENVVLYRYFREEDRLEKIATLLSGKPFLDSTIVRKDDWYYLFTSTSNSNLFQYRSEKLEGPYSPAEEHEVYGRNMKARSAGNFFLRDGKLIRPSQDCSVVYGGGLVFNEVLELNPQRYREKVMHEIRPESFGSDGVHTISGTEISVIDCKRTLFSLRKPFYRLLRKISVKSADTVRKPYVCTAGDEPVSRSTGTESISSVRSPLKILFLLDFYPFPEDKDGATKIMAVILRRIASRVDAEIVCVLPEEEIVLEPEEGIRVIKRPQQSTFQKLWNRLLFIPVNALPFRALKAFDRQIGFGKYDIVHSSQDSWIRLEKIHPRVVLGIYDSFSLGVKGDSWRDKVRKIYFRWLESRLSGMNFRFFMVSEKDASFFPAGRTWILPNGVDLDKYPPVDVPKIPDSFVFHGVLDYQPNRDAIRYMSGFLKENYPQGTLYLVGRNNRMTPEEFRQSIGDLSNCVLVGEVEDIAAEISKYRFYIALMVSGAGIKNKVLEALSCSCVVIANGKAIEGLAHREELAESVFVVEHSADFERVLIEKNSWEKRREMNRSFVQKYHSWDKYLEDLMRYYDKFMQGE